MKKSDSEELRLLREKEKRRQTRIKKANDNYNKTIERLNFTVPMGTKEKLIEKAIRHNLSINAYLQKLVLDDLKKE